jgi:hypothetical protein|nr:MAG: hypothetical protein [Bacteriophage sp.]DAN42920.1 MAG TPA: hypothetical protein [Caudoviricetes sp.]UVY02161.1 MAG: hypothetical protein [Bacteriophage sp.]UVY32799.1 MAG: hypothetical protein [Bacteriophage sp.]UWG22733.1 MAG: hypothetical protein [Bacteriophage sp.]
MEYFMGETFDREKNKPYKKLDAAEKAAEKVKAAVFDENGEVVKDFRGKTEAAAEPPQTATDGSQDGQPTPDNTDQDGQQQTTDTDQEGQGQQATMTDEVPEGALDTDADGSVPTYDADGNQVGTATTEEIKAAEEAVTENIDGMTAVRIKGKIRRVFNGSIRIRKAPSWSNDAVRGAAAFTEKIVTHVMEVDGKPMYKTLDGYFISGDPKLVEYIEE